MVLKTFSGIKVLTLPPNLNISLTSPEDICAYCGSVSKNIVSILLSERFLFVFANMDSYSKSPIVLSPRIIVLTFLKFA